jgi:hypothetical protein
MTKTNYGCIGCKHCSRIIIDGDEWGRTCTHPEKGIVPNPLSDNKVYGFNLIIHMDGTVELVMNANLPKCKEVRV